MALYSIATVVFMNCCNQSASRVAGYTHEVSGNEWLGQSPVRLSNHIDDIRTDQTWLYQKCHIQSFSFPVYPARHA